MAIKSAANHLIVEIQEPYQQNFYNAVRMANLDPGTSVNPADFATIVGKVISVPAIVCSRRDYKNIDVSWVKEGDKAIFSYAVVHSFTESQEGEAGFLNEFRIGAKYYWKVDVNQLYGVIRDRQIIMANDFAMITEVPPATILHITSTTKRETFAAEATILGSPRLVKGKIPVNVDQEQKVWVDRRKVTNYAIGEQKFGIIRQKDILAKQL